MVKGRLNVVIYVCSLAYLVPIIYELLSIYLGDETQLSRYYSFPSHLSEFMLGMLAYYLLQVNSFKSKINQHGKPLLLLVGVMAVGFINLRGGLLASYHIYGLLFLCVLLVSCSQNSRLPGTFVWIAKIGQQSYALYFTHLLLLKFAFVLQINYFNIGGYLLLASNIFLIIPMSLVLSNFVFHRIDSFFVTKVKLFQQKRVHL